MSNSHSEKRIITRFLVFCEAAWSESEINENELNELNERIELASQRIRSIDDADPFECLRRGRNHSIY